MCCICVRFKECFWRGKHNILIESVKILHIQAVIIQLITSLHSDYDISILTDNFMTSPIKVQRAVAQDDTQSPLLFNLIVNILIKTVKSIKVNVRDIYTKAACHQNIVITTMVIVLGKDNQVLCNAFIKWNTLPGLVIRVHRCHSFGIKRLNRKRNQFQPFITIKNIRILSIENGTSFIYLGKDFNFSMNCNEIKMLCSYAMKL